MLYFLAWSFFDLHKICTENGEVKIRVTQLTQLAHS